MATSPVQATQFRTAVNFKLGETVSHMRRAAGMNQGELGENLNLDQSAVSRVENGKQNLEPWQLQQLSEMFPVRVEQLYSGRINYWKIAQYFHKSPPFPVRYLEFPHSKQRSIEPTLRFVEEAISNRALTSFYEKIKVNPEYFGSGDQPMGAHFHFDLLHYLVENKILTSKAFPDWIAQTRNKLVHEEFNSLYSTIDSPLELVRVLVLNHTNYEENFEQRIVDSKAKSFTVSVTPARHMSKVDYKSKELGDLWCRYTKSYLSNFPIYMSRGPLKVVEHECHFHGALSCLYEFQVA